MKMGGGEGGMYIVEEHRAGKRFRRSRKERGHGRDKDN